MNRRTRVPTLAGLVLYLLEIEGQLSTSALLRSISNKGLGRKRYETVRKTLLWLEKHDWVRRVTDDSGRFYALTPEAGYRLLLSIRNPWELRKLIENCPGALGVSLKSFDRFSESVGEDKALRILKGMAEFCERISRTEKEAVIWDELLRRDGGLVNSLFPLLQELG